jgi:RNA polymerase sigma factor (sigma-70 family)
LESIVINIDVLYSRISPSLQHIVETDVRASDALIEEACQVAWTRLVESEVKSGAALAWLVTTAVREALRQINRARTEVSLDEMIENGDELAGGSAIGPEELVERREQLRVIDALPCRQQRMLLLQGAGFSYEEMAEREGCTVRTIERQLSRGRAALRAAA